MFQIYVLIVEKGLIFFLQISIYWWDGNSWDWGTQDGEVGGLVRVPPISASALTAGEMYLHVIRCTDEIIPPKLKQYFLLLFFKFVNLNTHNFHSFVGLESAVEKALQINENIMAVGEI